MLKPEHRLKKTRDFNLVMKQGRWTNGVFLDLKVLKLSNVPEKLLPKTVSKNIFTNQIKLAFSIGLKIDKKAVIRNRLKRQVRESVRLLLKDGRIKNGYYLLFVAKKEIKTKNYLEISEEATNLLKRAGVLL
jgi:ribonuclease P protein component